MFFFKSSKPKAFNFKPVYLKDKEVIGVEEINKNEYIPFADKMHQQWNRIPYSKLAQNGKKRIFSIALMTLVALYLVMKGFEYFSNFQ